MRSGAPSGAGAGTSAGGGTKSFRASVRAQRGTPGAGRRAVHISPVRRRQVRRLSRPVGASFGVSGRGVAAARFFGGCRDGPGVAAGRRDRARRCSRAMSQSSSSPVAPYRNGWRCFSNCSRARPSQSRRRSVTRRSNAGVRATGRADFQPFVAGQRQFAGDGACGVAEDDFPFLRDPRHRFSGAVRKGGQRRHPVPVQRGDQIAFVLLKERQPVADAEVQPRIGHRQPHIIRRDADPARGLSRRAIRRDGGQRQPQRNPPAPPGAPRVRPPTAKKGVNQGFPRVSSVLNCSA